MRRKSNTKNSIKKSMNEELQEKDFQKVIDEKDKVIRMLEFKVDRLERDLRDCLKLGSGEGGMINFYKQKLELEIEQNEKAFDLFLTLSSRMLKLNEMLSAPSELNDESSQVKGLLKLIGEGHDESQNLQSVSIESSEYENMEVVQMELNKRYEDLESICDLMHKNYMKTQKEYSSFEKRMKQLKKMYTDQIAMIQKELKQEHKQKEQLKILLQKNQEQRNSLLSQIANAFDAKTRKQLQKLGKQDIINYIKKLIYKISELQQTKTEVIKQNTKIKTTDYENYKKILNQVKQVKEMSRIGRSAF